MESRGRGRGYGRARGQAAGQPQQPQNRPGGPPRPPQQRPPQAAAGNNRPRGPQQPAWVRPAPVQQTPAAPPVWPRPQQGQAPPQQRAPPQVQQRPPQAQAAQAKPPQQPLASLGRGGRESEGAIPKRVVGQGEGEGNDTPGVGGRGGSSVRGRVLDNKREILYTRPQSAENTKKGYTGRPIQLVANYLPLEHKGKWSLYQYRVDMAPDIDDTRKRKALFRDAVREVITGGYLFDGTVMCMTKQLPNEPTELFVKDGEENVRITIKLVGDIAWGDPHYIQLFNILIRKCLTYMGLQLVGRNYYMPEAEIRLDDHKVQLWPGYFTSMRQHESSILLNVDLMFKFMRTDSVYDLLLECMSMDRGDGRAEFQRRVIGCVVLSVYNNKTYKIDDVDWNSTTLSTFKLKDGTEVSYKDYFGKKYNVRIRCPDQPMLVSRSKPREIRAGMSEIVYLVPELCTMTGLTDKQRENFNLMKALATHTRINVEGRIRKLKEFSNKIHSKPEVVAEIRRWDLNIGKELVKLEGRVLHTETILAGNSEKYSAGNQADWTRDLRSNHMLYTPTIDRLAVICTSKQKALTEDFLQLLSKAARGMHWGIGDPKYFETNDIRPGGYIEQVERSLSINPAIILCILPNNSQDRYSAIKKKCYVDKGIPTQMCVERTMRSKGVMSIATKVAIQMNCKIGGAPWSVSIPLSHLMVIGYDVCRDTANKKKSFSGMVASLDRHISRYFNMSVPHELDQELSDNFATFVVLACKKYKEVNQRYPDRIVIYRDGVGAGQLPYVYNHEVVEIKRRLSAEIYTDEPLKMAFIVVSKRINTRIMTERENPPPGTVVDSVITLPERYDFYIVSQCVRQGTVAPTNYNVIEDTVGLPPDRIQMLTFKLTHMYYNWSGTVRVPAPCQYAHKLAFMVSQNLHRSAHSDLENVLYYL